MKKTVQRIKLRPEGSPVKLDATIIECSPDGKTIRVQFDGPLEDLTLYAFGESSMLSDLKDKEGRPVTDTLEAATSREWRVL